MQRHTIAAAILAMSCTLGSTSGSAAPAAPVAAAAVTPETLRPLRHQAEQLAGASATPAQLKEAVARYQALLDYLARPDGVRQAGGSAELFGENINVRISLADAYARLGDKEHALATFEQLLTYAWLPPLADIVATNPHFASLRDEPRLRAVLEKSSLPTALWRAPALAQPYQPQLSVEQRVAGLSLFWTEARHSFAHFDHVPQLAWDQVYLEYLSKVIAATSTSDYYRVMMQLAPLLQDGHTNIYPPRELTGEFFSRPPVRITRVEERVLIESVDAPELAGRLHRGDEIVAIDGMPVQEYAERRVRPFVSSSTPQDLEVRMYSYTLLAGDAASSVLLRLRGLDGAERDETVARSGYAPVQQPPSAGFKMLPDGVAYVWINQFETDAGIKAFEQALPQIIKARGLVIDVRRNGGGDTEYGLRILRHLRAGPIPSPVSFVRADSGYARARGVAVTWRQLASLYQQEPPARGPVYQGPVAVLIGPKTFSAGEDFTASFDLMRRGVLVGAPTGGSTGQPLQLALPGGGSARICVKRDVYPDGRMFVGKGIVPDIAVRPTVAALLANRDETLDRAIAALGQAPAADRAE